MANNHPDILSDINAASAENFQWIFFCYWLNSFCSALMECFVPASLTYLQYFRCFLHPAAYFSVALFPVPYCQCLSFLLFLTVGLFPFNKATSRLLYLKDIWSLTTMISSPFLFIDPASALSHSALCGRALEWCQASELLLYDWSLRTSVNLNNNKYMTIWWC